MFLKDVPKGVKFVDTSFESSRHVVLEHYGLVHSGFDYMGESLYSYNMVHVGNIVGGEVKLFGKEDQISRSMSSRVGGIVECELVHIRE